MYTAGGITFFVFFFRDQFTLVNVKTSFPKRVKTGQPIGIVWHLASLWRDIAEKPANYAVSCHFWLSAHSKTFKVAQSSSQHIQRLRFWCVIITTLYQLILQSWYQKTAQSLVNTLISALSAGFRATLNFRKFKVALKISQFSTYIFSADISPQMLRLGRVTKLTMFFLVLVFVFNFDLFKFSATILEKGLLL